jgi:hypothetical protein
MLAAVSANPGFSGLRAFAAFPPRHRPRRT